MSGSIMLFSGLQRSGKTLLATIIAGYYSRKFRIPVYTNMNIPEFHIITELTQMPINRDPKILLLDEVHFFLNSRNFKQQADYIYFLNTICKRNILFLGTTITPDMVDKNLRIQLNYFVLCKKDNRQLYYKIFDVQNNFSKELHFLREQQLYDYQKYDSNEIPNMFNFNIQEYINLNENKSHFG